MISHEYQEAATETLKILENTDIDDVKKIPKKFLEFLEKISSKTYNPIFDYSKPIRELNLKPKTKALLGIIYLKYWANEEERNIFRKKTKEKEKLYQLELREKYNTNNLFKKKITAM